MRGSPLLRTLFVLIALLLAAGSLIALTRSGTSREQSASPSPEPAATASVTTVETPFVLTLSAPAKRVTLESAGSVHTFHPEQNVFIDRIPIATDHPTIFLTVNWENPTPPTPRFAKLVLESPGQPTRIGYFDARGDLEDVWEPAP